MTRNLLGLSAAILFFASATHAATPEREVHGTRLISPRDPAVTITLPRSAKYLGADRWDLYDICDAEVHVFVEPGRGKTIKKLYWLQFEQYLPNNTHVYNYTKDEPVTAWGLPVWQKARFGPKNDKPRAGSDLEHVLAILDRAGYELPAESMNVRLVHLPDPGNRKELMFIYLEDLAGTGHTNASLMDGEQTRPEWEPLKQALVERAKKSIKLKMK